MEDCVKRYHKLFAICTCISYRVEISDSHGNVATFDLPNAYFRIFSPHNAYLHLTTAISTTHLGSLFPVHLYTQISYSMLICPRKATLLHLSNARRTLFERLLNAFERLRLATGTPMPNHA